MPKPVFNRAVFIFSLIGLMVAGYLWQMHAHPADIPCGPSRGCETVATSPYSRFPPGVGPPVAAFGTLGYLALATLAFLRTVPGFAKYDRLLLTLIVLGAGVGSLASLWLTYTEVAVIHALCKWCLTSQTLILVVFVLAATEAVRHFKVIPKEPSA